jgi:hypothetical protein
MIHASYGQLGTAIRQTLELAIVAGDAALHWVIVRIGTR